MKHGLRFPREDFLPVTEAELWEVNGRGGSSSGSSSGSSYSSSPQSSVEKGRSDAAIGARQVAAANSLVAAGVPYGSSNNVTGQVSSTNASSYDCSGAMSAVAGRPYQTTANLMNPSTQAANGYVNAVSNSQAGTWTVVQYVDPKTGSVVGHTQMTMGDGTYFDSVDSRTRQGPSITGTSTQSYLQSQGITPISVAYLRPTN